MEKRPDNATFLINILYNINMITDLDNTVYVTIVTINSIVNGQSRSHTRPMSASDFIHDQFLQVE